MPMHPHTQMVTLPSISCVRHTAVQTHPRTVIVSRSKIHRLQLCPFFLHDLKLPVLSAPDMHTSSQQLTLIQAHMHTNESCGGNYQAELFMLADYQMFSFPLANLSPFPVKPAWLLHSQLNIHKTHTNLTIFLFQPAVQQVSYALKCNFDVLYTSRSSSWLFHLSYFSPCCYFLFSSICAYNDTFFKLAQVRGK